MEKILINFILPNGEIKKIEAPIGSSVLEIAHAYDIPLEGACEGSLACSTCHVVVQEEFFKGELAQISDEEADMLDLAPALTNTSRLGCQIRLTKAMDGVVFKIVDSFNFNPIKMGCQNCNCGEGEKK